MTTSLTTGSISTKWVILSIGIRASWNWFNLQIKRVVIPLSQVRPPSYSPTIELVLTERLDMPIRYEKVSWRTKYTWWYRRLRFHAECLMIFGRRLYCLEPILLDADGKQTIRDMYSVYFLIQWFPQISWLFFQRCNINKYAVVLWFVEV